MPTIKTTSVLAIIPRTAAKERDENVVWNSQIKRMCVWIFVERCIKIVEHIPIVDKVYLWYESFVMMMVH